MATTYYYLTNFRRLLIDGFSASELRRFCFDNPDFRPIYDHLSENSSKAQIIDRLLEYAEQKLLLKRLLAWAKEAEPVMYKQYQPYYAPSPSDVSPVDFLIVTVLEEERDAVLGKLPEYQQLVPSDEDIRMYFSSDLPFTFPDGSMGFYRVIIAPLLGMGRMQATIATAEAIRRWQPRYVILVGIAGGVVAKKVKLGDILVSNQIVDYELLMSTPEGPLVRWEVYRGDPRLLGTAYNLRSDSWQALITTKRPGKGTPAVHIGPIASGDKAPAFGEILERYGDRWPALVGVEMEAAGVATASFQEARKLGFLMVRGVSDLADKEKNMVQVRTWRLYACDIAASYVIALLKSGPVLPSSAIEHQLTTALSPRSSKDIFVKLKNPYTFGVPVRSGSKFFGREKELDLIFNTLEDVSRGQKQDMVILGPRRIGKSSLLYRLADLLTANKDFVPVYLDVQFIKPRTIQTLFLKILRLIRVGYEQKNLLAELPDFETLSSYSIPKDMDFLIFDEDMARLNEVIATKNLPRLVLMFDEVEVLVEFGGPDTLEWFRGLIQSMLYSIFIVAGSERLYSLTQDYGSPFFNIFKAIGLHPLSSDAARQLIEKPAAEVGMEISSTEVNKILRYAGNNPYFIQGIMHYLVEELNRQKRYRAKPEDVDKIIKRSVDNFSAQCAYIWGQISQVQRVILYALANQSGGPQTADALIAGLPQLRPFIRSRQEQQDVFNDLVRQQILKVKDNDRYWFIVLLFADWILSKVDDEEIIELTMDSKIRRVQVYNIRAIREFLTFTFSDEQLRLLAFDNFKPVYQEISHGMTKNALINRLIEYVERQNQLDKLLSLLRELNPAQYATFEKDLYEKDIFMADPNP